MGQSILVVGLHVYLMQKLTKILEDQGHFVISVFSSDMIGRNLRTRQFDAVLVNVDVNPRLRSSIAKAIARYQPNCKVLDAVYDAQDLEEMLS